MIGNGVSEENRKLIEDFEHRYPEYVVWATVIYSGFADDYGNIPSSPEDRHERASVYSRVTKKPLRHFGSTIDESLLLAEVLISELQSPPGRIQFQPELITRYLPQDVKANGWRCRYFWKGDDENLPWGPYRIGLVRDDGEELSIQWDQPWEGMDLLVGDIRQAASRS